MISAQQCTHAHVGTVHLETHTHAPHTSPTLFIFITIHTHSTKKVPHPMHTLPHTQFEEPVPELQLLREKLDLKRLLSTCPVARDAASAAAAQEDAPPVPPAVLTAARQQLRLNKRHMRCMWEVLLGTHTDVRSSSKGRPRLMELVWCWVLMKMVVVVVDMGGSAWFCPFVTVVWYIVLYGVLYIGLHICLHPPTHPPASSTSTYPLPTQSPPSTHR